MSLTNVVWQVQCNYGSVSCFRDAREKTLNRELADGNEEAVVGWDE